MKDPDQPEPDDPRRKEYDFQQAMAAQRQMASGTFGNHHSAILPDDNSQGDSKKSRLEAMISDAVKSAVTQITTNVAGVVQSFDSPPPKDAAPVTLQAQTLPQFRPQDVIQPQMAQPIGRNHGEPIIVQSPIHHAQASVQYPTPQTPKSATYSGIPPITMAPPSYEEIHAPKRALPPVNHAQSPLQALNKMAMPDRPIQEVRPSTFATKAGEPDAPQDPPKQDKRVLPQWPVDRAAWAPSEPFLDPGGKTADPQRSAYQAKSIEQGIEFSEAMDSYGMVMAEFTEAVTESIRVLTRRVNDMTRAIQGEGYDIR